MKEKKQSEKKAEEATVMLFGEVEMTLPEEPLKCTGKPREDGLSPGIVNYSVNTKQMKAFLKKYNITEKTFNDMVRDHLVKRLNEMGIECKSE